MQQTYLSEEDRNSSKIMEGVVESVVEVVESPWVVGTVVEPPERRTEEVESHVVVDYSQQFYDIFQQMTFDSFTEFEDLFNKFKSETGTVFRIKSSCSVEYENSRRKKHVIPTRFKFVSIRYCCVHYGHPKVAGQGIRTKQRYLPCGCECILALSYNRGALVISHVTMQHNHEVSSQMAPYYAINRRISNAELKQVADVVEVMPNSRALQQFLQKKFHRPTTIQDAKNIRARLKALKNAREARLMAVQSIKLEPSLAAKDNEGDRLEELQDEEEEMLREENIIDDEGNEGGSDEDEYVQCSEEFEQVQQQQKAEVVDMVKEKLSAALFDCDTDEFLNRISIINKVFECWDNGADFEINNISDDCNAPSEAHLIGRVKSDAQLHSNSQVASGTDTQMIHERITQIARDRNLTNYPKALQTRNETCIQISSERNIKNGSEASGLLELCGNSTSLELSNLDQSNVPIQSIVQTHHRKENMQVSNKNDYILNKRQLIAIHSNKPKKQIHNIEPNESPYKVKRDRYKNRMQNEAIEIEIEVNGGMAKVKQVKVEPLEYYEVNVT